MASVVHISEAEAARDFAAIMRRARSGEEIVVENESGPAVVIKTASSTEQTPRTAGEVIQAFTRWEAEHGAIKLDKDFARDMEEIHREYNRPMDDRWE